MEVKIENFIINETVEFLYNANLRGKQSRHRSRFIRQLNSHIDTIMEEQQELLKIHCNAEADGTPKIVKDKETGVEEYDFKDEESKDKFIEERNGLFEEKLVIDDGNSRDMLLTVRQLLDEYDGDLSGRKAVLYDHLCEIFKVDEEIEEETD